MKQTNNYDLSLWEKSDRILMEDFNGDNEKVDAALAGLAAEVARKADTDTVRAENLWVKLGEQTLDAAGSQLAVTFPNAEQYRSFQLYFSGSGPLVVSLSVNGKSDILGDIVDGSSSTKSLFLMGGATVIRGGVKGVHVAGDVTIYDGDYEWGRENAWMDQDAALTGSATFQLTGSSGKFTAGTQLVLYGLKA